MNNVTYTRRSNLERRLSYCLYALAHAPIRGHKRCHCLLNGPEWSVKGSNQGMARPKHHTWRDAFLVHALGGTVERTQGASPVTAIAWIRVVSSRVMASANSMWWSEPSTKQVGCPNSCLRSSRQLGLLKRQVAGEIEICCWLAAWCARMVRKIPKYM